MLSLVDIDRLLINYSTVVSSQLGHIPSGHSEAIRGYISYLKQESIFRDDADLKDHPALLTPEETGQYLKSYDRALYKEAPDKEDLRVSAQHSRWSKSDIKEVLEIFGNELPDYEGLFNLYVKVIVLDSLNKYGSASASDSLGVISINCKNHFNAEDIIEMLVHELVHNLVFVDNVVQPYFRTGLRLEETYVHSAVRGNDRPLHLAMHALFVAVELLGLRKHRNRLSIQSNIHPASKELKINCLASITAILQHQDFLTNTGRSLVERCLAKVGGV